MDIVIAEFSMMAINLFAAKIRKDKGLNPAINYFVAGMTFGFGLSKLITLI